VQIRRLVLGALAFGLLGGTVVWFGSSPLRSTLRDESAVAPAPASTSESAWRAELAAVRQQVSSLQERLQRLEELLTESVRRPAGEVQAGEDPTTTRLDVLKTQEIVGEVFREREFAMALREARSVARENVSSGRVPDNQEERLAQILAKVRVAVNELQDQVGLQLTPSKKNEFVLEEGRKELIRWAIPELMALSGDLQKACDILNSWVGYEALYCSTRQARELLDGGG